MNEPETNRPQFTVGANAVIFDERGRVLLVHRTDLDCWNLPGGGLIDGETPWATVMRETKEETGYDVQIDVLTGIYLKEAPQEIVFTFRCTISGGEQQLNDEASAIEYYALDALPKNISPKHIERIRDAVEPQAPVSLKVQRGPRSHDLFTKTDASS